MVDASVAASSGTKEHPQSRRSREALDSIAKSSCHVGYSAALLREWNDHQSVLALRWRASMVARRRVTILEVPEDPALRHRLGRALDSDRERAALHKDTHLIEAALRFSRRILSSDHRSLNLARKAAGTVREIGSMQWADAVSEGAEACRWVLADASDEYAFRLDRHRGPTSGE